MRRTILVGAIMAILCANLGVTHGALAETICIKSGQVSGVPGIPGQFDDIVRFNPGGNPVAAPLLAQAAFGCLPPQFPPFCPAFFTATEGGSFATLIQPHPAWFSPDQMCDTDARWINFGPPPPPPGGLGTPGSALYAVPFTVTSQTITSATLCLEGGVDDVLGDWATQDGPNFDGLYINGMHLNYMQQGFNFLVPTTHSQDITGLIQPGLNYLFFYQRDVGAAVSGLIFSACINVNGCGDLPCVIPPKDPGNVVTVNNCTSSPVATFNNWTQINLPSNDVVLNCALTPLTGTDSVRIIARSIKVAGTAGSVSAFGKQGIEMTASGPCLDATIEILSANIISTNPNGKVKVTACGDIVAIDSNMKSMGGDLSLTSTGGKICAALDSFFGNTVTLESRGDLTLRGSSVETIGPRDFTRLISDSGSVLAGSAFPLDTLCPPCPPCPPNSFHGGVESNMTVTAALLVNLSNACVQEAENITITGGVGLQGCTGTIVDLTGAEIRNDFGKTGDIRATACSGLGTIDITDAVLVNEGARGGGPDPGAVSILNGGQATTTNCPAVVPNPPHPSCNNQPIDTVKRNPVCAAIRGNNVIGTPKVDR